MNKINTLLILCLISLSFTVSCSAQNEPSKGSLFIIGGGSRPVDMVKTIVSESGIDKGGYAIILPMSSEEPDTAIYYGKLQFNKLGLKNVYGLQFTKGEELNQSKVDSIRKAKLVYISGGRSEERRVGKECRSGW